MERRASRIERDGATELRDRAREVALGEQRGAEIRVRARVVRREVMAGVLNGLSLALVLGAGGALIFGSPLIGLVLGLAMVVNQIVACLGGVTVPLVLHRIGLDPALASGTFVTTLTDVMGFLAFLGLATMILT